MSRLFTKTGDKGYTSLADGTRVAKTDIRIETNGSIDELNAILGLAKAITAENGTCNGIERIQNNLTTIMSAVACAEVDLHDIEEETTRMEQEMSERNTTFSFVLPGSDKITALLHLARAKARTCERMLWHTNALTPLPHSIMVYMNRLSDYLFFLGTSPSHLGKDLPSTTYQDIEGKGSGLG